MISGLKNRWRTFRAHPAGERFRTAYEARRARSDRAPWWRKPLVFGIAGLLFLVGLVLAVAPGPAIVFFFAAAILVAGESRNAARLLDWLDHRCEPLVRKLARRWKSLPEGTRRAAIVGMACVSVLSIVVGLFRMRG
ncbi:hypothetical protein ASA1KI_22590 [Opitutales bacterium ASA1]|uniref:hypothetical protein n=1 Tax=Congregicoccus parvus TaxID=3081749 RepID=UPI002B2D148F|nr:hypothetical protein ASA1KI_22590 [Opitutales bacterium ASA1]